MAIYALKLLFGHLGRAFGSTCRGSDTHQNSASCFRPPPARTQTNPIDIYLPNVSLKSSIIGLPERQLVIIASMWIFASARHTISPAMYNRPSKRSYIWLGIPLSLRVAMLVACFQQHRYTLVHCCQSDSILARIHHLRIQWDQCQASFIMNTYTARRIESSG
ncbi:hypothetical protein C8R43DRAFT_1129109 [Mycena crocata]|nr:hypothetical protein C8R43DRAFT_1129109 [Mycena crocata]